MMSSLTRRPNGHAWISYKFAGKRHTLRLGAANDEIAGEVKRRLDFLIEYAAAGMQLPSEIAAWLNRLDERYYNRLVTAGLVQPRGPSRLSELIEAHYRSLISRGRKESTLVNNRVVHNNLLSFFGGPHRLSTITRQAAEEFKLHLMEKGGRNGGPLARATVSNRCRRARSLFTYAVQNGWLDKNPFLDVKGGPEWNKDRDAYVLPEIFERILSFSVDHELRLLLALVRYCGLRCPSEIWPLRWVHVDRAAGIFIVHSSKTELYGDGGRRTVPIFPAVVPYLDAAWEAAPKGEELIFPRYQVTGAAITGKLAALCRKAGEVLWPKPMVNLRASAVRDALAAHQNIFEVAPWFGHSPTIQLQHYSRVVKEREARKAHSALLSEPEASDEKRNQNHHSCP